jgi:hypothetical protein
MRGGAVFSLVSLPCDEFPHTGRQLPPVAVFFDSIGYAFIRPRSGARIKLNRSVNLFVSISYGWA